MNAVTRIAAADRVRHDGWTPDRQTDFLSAIAEGQTVEAAARNVGMSATSAYSFRRRAPGAPFALGWSAANLLARERLAAILFSRVIDGQVETVTRPDGSVYARHRFDNRLGTAMLARLDRYADDPANGPALAAAQLVAQEFDAFLETIGRDDGPARAGLFLGARAAGDADIAPIVALARADRWCRTGTALAGDVDISDLDPAGRMHWTAEQWQRAEAAGLFVPAAPAADEAAQGPQLSQLRDADPDEDEDFEPVWWDEAGQRLRTCFPPPDEHACEEDGVYGEDGYSRTLTPEEEAALREADEAGLAEMRRSESAERDAYFGFASGLEPQAGRRSGHGSAPGPDAPWKEVYAYEMAERAKLDAVLKRICATWDDDENSPSGAEDPPPGEDA